MTEPVSRAGATDRCRVCGERVGGSHGTPAMAHDCEHPGCVFGPAHPVDYHLVNGVRVPRTGATDREVAAQYLALIDRLEHDEDRVEVIEQAMRDARVAAAPTSGQREDGAALIATERVRQVQQEGWTPEHDATHRDGRLALAAICYALPESARTRVTTPGGVPMYWPWERRWWKPRPDDRVRELVKAGALIAAEIDRLQAAALLAEQPGGDHRG